MRSYLRLLTAILLLAEFVAVLVVAAGACLWTSMFINDAATYASSFSWWREAGLRFASTLPTTLLVFVTVFLVNGLVVARVFTWERRRVWAVSAIAAGIVLVAGLTGSLYFGISKPLF